MKNNCKKICRIKHFPYLYTLNDKDMSATQHTWEMTFQEFAKEYRCWQTSSIDRSMQWKFQSHIMERKHSFITIDTETLDVVKRDAPHRDTYLTFKDHDGNSYNAKRKAYMWIVSKALELGLYEPCVSEKEYDTLIKTANPHI